VEETGKMYRKVITLCYRKIIDARSPGRWEKLVFEDSYAEFLIQSQLYNPEKKYTRFSDMLQYAPGAEKLHFLVSASVINYVKPLNNRMPDITNNLGKSFLHFQHYFFEIINSDIRDRLVHSIAINFCSSPLIWHDTVGDYLLLSEKKDNTLEEVQTDILQLRPFLSIHSLQTEQYD